MKKIFCFCLAFCLVLSFAGCKKKGESKNNESGIITSSKTDVSSEISSSNPEDTSSSKASDSSVSSKVSNCIHNFAPATCEKPSTCTKCGETTGSLGEHEWNEATCISLKTCSVCGKAEGEFGEHNYVKGACTVCKKEDLNYGMLTSHLWQTYKSGRLISLSFSNENYCEEIVKPYSELPSGLKTEVDETGEKTVAYVSGNTKLYAVDGESFTISFKEEENVVTIAVTEGPDNPDNGKFIVFERIGKTQLKVTKSELTYEFWQIAVDDVLTIKE